ncbi:MAG: tetratricopeptide repeat protein, partial [Treponema sp.]|nr:tetratricopeptide repeat protein [Treponema sp.]
MMKWRFLCIFFILVSGCAFIPSGPEGRRRGEAKPDPYYLAGNRENRENLEELFTLLLKETGGGENQFALIREIANTYAKLGEYQRLIYFLGRRTNEFPDDPYNAYYLLMIGYAYLRQDAAPVAARYFDIIVKNYPDLTVLGQSIHLACLNQLIDLVDKPEQRVW